MNYPTLVEIEKRGAFKVFATSKLTNSKTPGITGWYYPLYLSIEEAIAADKINGGKGIFNTHTFYELKGEFYSADSFSFFGKTVQPSEYPLYRGEGATNPFDRIKFRLSELIEDQLPGFVREEYEKFIIFLKAYYEFLEQDNKAQEVLQNLHKYSDLDETAEELVDKFFKTYAYDISFSDISDNRFFLKNIRELYSKKGTEVSYKILFSFLFKETIEFFFPYTVVLKASDGKWKTRYSLKVQKVNENQNIYDFKNTVVIGNTSGAQASVNNVLFFNIGEYEFYELELEENSIQGDFLAEEIISATKNFAINTENSSLNLNAQLYSVISKVQIEDPGLGYEAGKEITIQDSTGKYAKAKITGVDLYGKIRSIEIIDSGFDYSSSTTIDPGLPTKILYGTYSLTEGKVELTFPAKHGITIGKNVEVKYTGNIFSPVNEETHSAVILSVPDPRKVKYRYPGF